MSQRKTVDAAGISSSPHIVRKLSPSDIRKQI